MYAYLSGSALWNGRCFFIIIIISPLFLPMMHTAFSAFVSIISSGSGVARAFPGWKNEDKMMKKSQNNWLKIEEKWGKWNSCPPGIRFLPFSISVFSSPVFSVYFLSSLFLFLSFSVISFPFFLPFLFVIFFVSFHFFLYFFLPFSPPWWGLRKGPRPKEKVFATNISCDRKFENLWQPLW